MHVVLDEIIEETPDIRTFRFKPETPFEYIAGQFIEMYLPHENADERGEKHWFTLSSSPTQDFISITTRFSERSSTFKQTLRALKKGDQITISEPMGDFVLPKDPSIPLVFVAGGIGITPFHSILTWLADTEEERSIQFIHAIRTEDDIIFQDTFKAVGVEPIFIVSQPSDEWGGERGTLTGKHILQLTEPLPNALIYVSGPEPMVEDLEKQLHAEKIPKNRIVLDFFPGYEPI